LPVGGAGEGIGCGRDTGGEPAFKLISFGLGCVTKIGTRTRLKMNKEKMKNIPPFQLGLASVQRPSWELEGQDEASI
jgi:hypothetical protein